MFTTHKHDYYNYNNKSLHPPNNIEHNIQLQSYISNNGQICYTNLKKDNNYSNFVNLQNFHNNDLVTQNWSNISSGSLVQTKSSFYSFNNYSRLPNNVPNNYYQTYQPPSWRNISKFWYTEKIYGIR